MKHTDTEELKKRISLHSRRLQLLKEQQAVKGIGTDPAILIEIEQIEETLEKLYAELNTDDAKRVSPDTFNIINDALVSQYKQKRRKQWRELEHLKFAVLSDSDNSRDMFIGRLVYALHSVFCLVGYVRFNGLLRVSKVSKDGHELPIYHLVCHQPEFCETVRREQRRFIDQILKLKDSGVSREAAREEIIKSSEPEIQFEKEWIIEPEVLFASEWVPLEFVYDPATKRVSLQSLIDLSIDLADYPNGLNTTSEVLCFVASLAQARIAFFPNFEMYNDNYSVIKLMVDFFDRKIVDFSRIRVNAGDYEEWDYINRSFDIEVRKRSK